MLTPLSSRPQQGAGDGRHLWWRTLWRDDETQNVLLECAFFSPLSITVVLVVMACIPMRLTVMSVALSGTAAQSDGTCDPSADRHLRGEAGPVIDITNEATLPKRATLLYVAANWIA